MEDLEMIQFDVKTAFLHGELREDIWIALPDGLWPDDQRIIKLNKSLYGLKQSLYCWNCTFNALLKNFKMDRSPADECLYIGQRDGEFIYLLLYVDDGMVISKSKSVLQSFIADLGKAFEVKVNEPRYFIGFEIERDRTERSLRLYQYKYISRLIERFQMIDAKVLSVPMDPCVRYSKAMCPTTDEERKEMKNKTYNELLGCLQFVANLTRPDIAFSVNLLSRFKSVPGEQHWVAAKKILHYLRKTSEQGIIY